MQITKIIGTKQDMTVRFNIDGKRSPVTIIKAEPNTLYAIGDGYQLGYGSKKKVKKTEAAYMKLSGVSPQKLISIKTKDDEKTQLKSGDKITVSNFNPGDLIKVSGITKGRGFAGVVKRWGFAGGPKTHGQSDRHRAPGSIGQGTTPGRVFKGKKMAGHMGVKKLTVINLEVVEINEANNTLFVKGSVPGSKNSYLIIEKIGKVKTHIPYKIEEKEESKEQTLQETKNTITTQKPSEDEKTIESENTKLKNDKEKSNGDKLTEGEVNASSK